MQKSRLKISEYRHNGRLQSRVYYPKGSPNKPSGGYKWYRSRAASEQAIIENNALQKRYGEIAKDVTLRELVEARQAKDELTDTGLTLLDAARQVKLALNAALESKSVGDGLNAYLEDVRSKFDERKEHSPRSEPRHWRSVKRSIARLEPLKNFSLREITADNIRPLLKGLTKSSLSSHLRNLHAAFQYCADHGWQEENPASGLKRMKADKASRARSVQTYSVQEVERIMEAAITVDMRTVPYLAICFFAGVRPEAAMKMKWSDVSANGYLYVPHTANKSGHAYNAKCR